MATVKHLGKPGAKYVVTWNGGTYRFTGGHVHYDVPEDLARTIERVRDHRGRCLFEIHYADPDSELSALLGVQLDWDSIRRARRESGASQ